jgi:hypothetical protein
MPVAKTGIITENSANKTGISIEIDPMLQESTSRWFICPFARRSPE